MTAPIVKGHFIRENKVNWIAMNGHWSFVNSECLHKTTIHLSLPPEHHQKNRTVRHSTIQH